MNFANFAQFAGAAPGTAVHHFASAKMSGPGAQQMGQVVGVLSGGEGGVHYLRPVDGGAGFQALPHPSQQQQLITLPITVPGAKPGDPQQTLQIQVMNPNVSALTSQVSMHQPKYQMAHIPLQTFPQGTVLTVAYAQQDGEQGVQLVGGGSLPEGDLRSTIQQIVYVDNRADNSYVDVAGLQVVAAIQPQDMQMLTAHMPAGTEHLLSGGNKSQDSDGQHQQQTVQISMMPSQPLNNADDAKKSNNNNPTFRIKQENINGDELMKIEEVEVGGQQWTVTSPNADIAEYLCHIPGGAQLHQFLRFNNEASNSKSEGEGSTEAQDDASKDKEQSQQGEENESDTPVKAKKKKKYKKKPPKPKKPKPGQVVIATALDGSLLYCCPECHMAYPKKELLEHHLSGHKIERRYICGICGAGLKRREHLERHKLGHNPDRPFVCSICLKGFKRKEHLNLHFVIHSGEKTEICPECGKGFYRKDHLRKHTRAHASRRAREEMVAQFQQQKQQQQQVTFPETSAAVRNDGNRQGASTSALPAIQPEITIHVSTSTSSVPVHITIPQNLMTMASNNSGTNTTDTINIKQEMDNVTIP